MTERQKAIKALDKVFSEFIRRRDAGVCITCGKKQDWKRCDAGHYIRRGIMQFRWNERNVHAQCKKCNSWGEGEKDIYRQKLIQKYSVNLVELMESDRHKTYHFPLSDMKVLIDYYKKQNSVKGD